MANYLPIIVFILAIVSSAFSVGDVVVDTKGIADAAQKNVESIYGGVDSFFSCDKYDGYAGCWKNDWEKRDRMCKGCPLAQRYEHRVSGRCYCCKCS